MKTIRSNGWSSILVPALVLTAVGWAQPARSEAPLASSGQGAVARSEAPGSNSDSEAGFGVLIGRWVRPDGGYTITIRSIEGGGQLDASYANPNVLPFSKAEASRDGKTINVFLELRAGGYNGSTYTLIYDPAKDVLKGVYYQAVAQQRFDVYFERSGG